MRRELILLLAAVLVPVASVSGDITWNGGHHLIQSGELIDDTLRTYNGTIVDMLGGEISGSLGIHDTSTFNFSDGLLHGVTTYRSGTLNASGGMMGHLQLYDNSVVNISGGGVVGSVYAVHSTIINVYGYGFDYVAGGMFDGGTFSGFWGDGTTFVMNLDDWSVSGNHTYDHIILHDVSAIPTPGAFLLGSIGLSLAGWKLGTRKD